MGLEQLPQDGARQDSTHPRLHQERRGGGLSSTQNMYSDVYTRGAYGNARGVYGHARGVCGRSDVGGDRGAFETDETRLCVPVHYVNVVVRGP